MFLPFTGEAPIVPEPIQIVIEVKQKEPKEKIYTVEEKIASNYYKCDEDIEYIRRDNAKCLSKPIPPPSRVNTQVSRENTPQPIRNSSSVPSGWYPYGQCTYLVSIRRPVGRWNNASEWYWQAQRDGWSTGTTPEVGAIAWEPGHVSYVIAVKGNNVTVEEMNYKGFGVLSTRTAPASQFRYIY